MCVSGQPLLSRGHVQIPVNEFKHQRDQESSAALEAPSTQVIHDRDILLPDCEAGMYIGIFGVFLPLIALVVELHTGMSAEIYIDPIPTWWHTCLIAFVPISNAVVLWAVHRQWADRATHVLLLNGLAIGISAIYTMIYLPMMLVGLFGILVMGLGFLPLSPVTSFTSSLMLCAQVLQLRALGEGTQPSSARLGRIKARYAIGLSLVAGVAMILVGEVPAWVARQGLTLATSDSPQHRRYGVQFLRRFSSERILAEQCLNRRSLGLIPRQLEGISRNESQRVFFEVTGKPLNSVRLNNSQSRGRWWQDFDAGLGGEEVANQVDGLSMIQSRIDVSADAQASVVYTEWTMVFQNDAFEASEARAQILLPPDGVVSRLTLWVNNEPREAAFSSTGKVRSAYQEVAVRQRRDPVLVTWKGTDRVLMQCFPVPANGGTMKVRLGITAPMQWHGHSMQSTADLASNIRLAQIIEQNFSIPDGVKHAIWVDSDSPLRTTSEQLTSKSKVEQYVLAGLVGSDQLIATNIAVDVKSSRSDFRVRSVAGRAGEMFIGSLQPERIGLPKKIVVVLDGSRTMASHSKEIATAIVRHAKRADIHILLAADEIIELSEHAVDADALARQIKRNVSSGGCDNVEALVTAWDIADDSTEILWIHGPQPIHQADNTALAQRIDNADFAPPIWDMQIVTGPNRAFEGVQDRLNIERVNFDGALASNLDEWWQGLQHPVWSVAWQLAESAEGAGSQIEDANATLRHAKVKDLWAWQRVRDLLKRSYRTGEVNYAMRNEAMEVAAAHHLVTPVSGAVVLETQDQYEQNGLTPVDQLHHQNVTTPEPSGQLLTLLAILPVVHFLRRRRRDACQLAERRGCHV